MVDKQKPVCSKLDRAHYLCISPTFINLPTHFPRAHTCLFPQGRMDNEWERQDDPNHFTTE